MRYHNEIEYRGIVFEVEGEYIPFMPGKDYLHNGDPGYPDEGNCFDDFSIRIDGQELSDVLDSRVVDDLYELAIKEAAA